MAAGPRSEPRDSLIDQELTPAMMAMEIESKLPGATVELEPEQEMMTVNMGPHHPATHGVLRLVVDLEGEVVKDLKPIVGYVHTGIEKSCESMSYWKVIPFVERMDYLSYFFNMQAYCGAVETLTWRATPASSWCAHPLMPMRLAPRFCARPRRWWP